MITNCRAPENSTLQSHYSKKLIQAQISLVQDYGPPAWLYVDL
jgi:hypothetical protein